MQENQDENRNEEPFARLTQPIESPAVVGPPSPLPVSKPRANTSLPWIIGGMLALALILSLVVIQYAYNRLRHNGAELPAAPANAEMASPVGLSNSFREIARAVKPAVVHINVVETVEPAGPSSDILPFDFPQQGPRRRPGSGSGFVVREDGYILTNNHVVQKAEKIEVTLSNSKKYRATLVGTDPESDLAVIKIDESGLPFAVLGDSDQVEQGDWVLALGSPFGLQQTLTAGIVSATGRELRLDSAQYSKFIQTDASINPGNSGGPLVNMRGEVVGINTLIFSQSGSSEGIGFAISSNTAKQIYDQLVRNGKVTRGYLGVSVTDINDATARALGVEADSGALVADVPGGDTPAARAGLKSGDVITTFDGKPVKSSRQLTDAVAATPVGKSVRVDFIRDGRSQSITVDVAERPMNVNAQRNSPLETPGPDVEPKATKLGITVQPVTPEIADRMKLKEPSGVMIRSVDPGSPASEAGLRHGDVIHRVGKTEIKSTEDLTEAVKALAQGEEVAIQVERGGRMTFITVTIE